MSSSSNPLLSHVTIIKQFHFHAEFHSDDHFKGMCTNLQESGRFKSFKWPEKFVFSKHFREEEETFRTFEMKGGLKVLGLPLIKAKLSGTVRILTTLYRAGFAVLSIIHSIIPQKKAGEVKGKNLTPDTPLTSIDVNYLLEDQTPDHCVPLTYEVEIQKTKSEITTPGLIEYLLKNLADHGVNIIKMPRKFTRMIQCWNPSLSSKPFEKLLEKYYKDIFIMFTTPKEGSLPDKSKKAILKDLKSYLHSSSSRNRGFFVGSISMLIISPRKGPPHRILHSQPFWIFQLVSLEDFMLKFYSKKIRKIVPKIGFDSSDQFSSLLEKVTKLRAAFSLCLEDLYWVENDLFRIQSATLVTEYKKKFKLEEKLNTLLKRFAWIQDRCEDTLRALEHRAQTRREKSITNLTLIFATFGLGEILSTIIIWYFGYISAGEPTLELNTMILGLAAPFLFMSAIYLIARWYVNKNYKEAVH